MRTGRAQTIEVDALRRELAGWFAPRSLDRVLGRPTTETQRLLREWLSRGGRRWRPLLTAGTYRALQRNGHPRDSMDLHRLAVAVECFHKASLVHDDIEDGDSLRDGRPTLHAEYGVPTALNVGDLLLGEGYRLIAALEIGAARKAALLRVAAEAHRDLCIGQGRELSWVRKPGPLTAAGVLAIYRGKTSPAFRVALRFGSILAGADRRVAGALDRFSGHVGVAYQFRDDLDDVRPSSQAASRASVPAFAVRGRAGRRRRPAMATSGQMTWLAARLDDHAREALRACRALRQAELRDFLSDVCGRILSRGCR